MTRGKKRFSLKLFTLSRITMIPILIKIAQTFCLHYCLFWLFCFHLQILLIIFLAATYLSLGIRVWFSIFYLSSNLIITFKRYTDYDDDSVEFRRLHSYDTITNNRISIYNYWWLYNSIIYNATHSFIICIHEAKVYVVIWFDNIIIIIVKWVIKRYALLINVKLLVMSATETTYLSTLTSIGDATWGARGGPTPPCWKRNPL